MVLVHLAEGFEEVEALTVVDLLRRAGIDCKTVSVTGRLPVNGAHGVQVTADLLFDQADYKAAEMIVLPGGLPGTDNLAAHSGLTAAILDFAEQDKPLAAICAAPSILGGLGLLKGRNAVIYPGLEGKLTGAVVGRDNVVTDGNITTSKGPGTAMEFALELIRRLKGKDAAQTVRQGVLLG
ncbi:MAG TPA: DJ-1/PfpI family protein [Clostridiales bacterium]|jgi:4-methyl-5(b-hydroxyethyl)-thiazole monophosphate biosynthesis|nr:DJ-1/PfpI family protein [Clostridiales bacterium]